MIINFDINKRVLSDIEIKALKEYLSARFSYERLNIWNLEIIHNEGVEKNILKVYVECKKLSSKRDVMVLSIPIWNILKIVEYYEKIKQKEIIDSQASDGDDDDPEHRM